MMTRQRRSFTAKYVWNKLLNWFCSAFSIWELSTWWATLLMLYCKMLVIRERTTKDDTYQLLWKWIVVPLNTAKGSVLLSTYKVLTAAKHRMSTGDWFLPSESGTTIARVLCCTDLKCIYGAWKAQKGTKIFVCGTQDSHRYQYWINVQSTCPSC